MKTDHEALEELARIADIMSKRPEPTPAEYYENKRHEADLVQGVIRGAQWEPLALKRLNRALEAAREVGD
jgi:hypothetical protein